MKGPSVSTTVAFIAADGPNVGTLLVLLPLPWHILLQWLLLLMSSVVTSSVAVFMAADDVCGFGTLLSSKFLIKPSFG